MNPTEIRSALIELIGGERSDFANRENRKVIYANRSIDNVSLYTWDHAKDTHAPIPTDSIFVKVQSLGLDSKEYKGKEAPKLHVICEGSVTGQPLKIEMGLETVTSKGFLCGFLLIARKYGAATSNIPIGIQFQPSSDPKSEKVLFANLFNPESGEGIKKDEGMYKSLVIADAIAEINRLMTAPSEVKTTTKKDAK